MLYHTYETAHAALAPMRETASAMEWMCKHPGNPFAYTMVGRAAAASCNVFRNLTRRHGKPEFGISETMVDGMPVPVEPHVVLRKPFCNLLHFAKGETGKHPSTTAERSDPKVLIVAPLSGHYATLLRGTVRAMLSEHDVYVTDWKDARGVPLMAGTFDFHDYVDYTIDIIRALGADTHVIAVCQPAVPVLVATALMAAAKDPGRPRSLTLMGGPIDPRRNPTAVNEHAIRHDLEWFKRNVISLVPYPNAGWMRPVYPGFIQLAGFLAMNLDRHMDAHRNYYSHLVEGDADSAAQHRTFYDEYLAVMDLTAEFFLQTVEYVFHDNALASGTLMHQGQRVDCAQIRDIALLTVEGEKDDICAVGQTEAAQDLCSNIPRDYRHHYVQPGVGHYGVFNGTRWRSEIQPRIRDFIRGVESAGPRA